MRTSRRNAVLALLTALAMALGLSGCGGGGDAKADFVGLWELESIEGSEGSSAEDIAMMKEMGLVVTLDLADDGKAVLDFMGDALEGTWTAKDGTTGSLNAEGDAGDLILRGGKLTLASDEDKMIFVRSTGTTNLGSGLPSGTDSDEADEPDDDAVEPDDEAAEPEDDAAEPADESLPANNQPGDDGSIILIDNEYATVTLSGAKIDWADDPGYVLEIANNHDVPIYVTGKSDSFSVDGLMLQPVMSSTVNPGKFSREHMYFRGDDLGGGLERLVNVEGTISVRDDDSWDVLSETEILFPDASELAVIE